MRRPSLSQSRDNGSGNERHVRISTSSPNIASHILHRRDVFGRTILHICILSNDTNALRHILRAPETRNIFGATDYENGWNILHYIFYHKRLRCLNVVLSVLETNSARVSPVLAELLDKKDRAGATPLSLLQNDVKDFFWVPEYINEKNKFHLTRRFGDSGKKKDSAGQTRDDEDRPASPELPDVPDLSRTRQTVFPSRDTSAVALPVRRHVDHDWWLDTRGGSDIYVVGANVNSNLGLGDSHDRTHPSKIEPFFPRDLGKNRNKNGDKITDLGLRELLVKPRYRFIKMSKYHSVICTTDGKLYTCGIGSRGRLGLGNASNSDHFKQVLFPRLDVSVVACTVSNNHTVIVSASGAIFAWGNNTVNQLGFTSSAPANSFKKIADVYENSPVEVVTGDLRKSSSTIKGVEASKIHTLAYSSRSLYFWGLNVGQIVLPEDGIVSDHRINEKTYRGVVVPQPKEVTVPDEIKCVTSCETCTCVVTVSNDIYMYYLGQRVKLPKIPSHVGAEAAFDLFKPSRLTLAPAIKKIAMKTPAFVHILLENGDVMAFSVTSDDVKALRSIRYTFAWLAYETSMRAVDIDNSFDGSLLVCTRNGSVLLRSNLMVPKQRRTSSTLNTGAGFQAAKNKFKKLEGINRVLRVVSNDLFSSFAFIRDDIDSLPYKLQKNDFFKDMEYLSPLIEPDMYRKQDQLLDLDHDMNCYVTDFLYPTEKKAEVSDEDNLLIYNRLRSGGVLPGDETKLREKYDLLRKQMLSKYAGDRNKKPGTNIAFQKLSESDTLRHFEFLRSNVQAKTLPLDKEWPGQKFADGKIEFAHSPGSTIGIHTKILQQRSKLCRQIFRPVDADECFVHQHIEGAYLPESKTILFRSPVEPLAVLVFIYFVYTNTLLDFWREVPSSDANKDKFVRIKTDFLALMTLFKMDILYGKDDMYLKQFEESSHEEADADVIIGLSDGDHLYCSSLVIARSAFFETILSGRWDTSDTSGNALDEENEPKYVGLQNIRLLHMKIVLQHLQGRHDLHVFDEAKEVLAESENSDDFVNFLLELIEIADELLLVQLKHICELAIKEFIDIDNVLIILGHADWLGAKKLFMSCCWYVYNNLDLILFDQNIRDLDGHVLQKMEVQMHLLDKCKHPHFVVGNQGEVDWGVFCEPSVFEKEGIVDRFVNEPRAFDEVFMSDAKGFSSFEPLIDLKMDSLSSSGDRRKLAARKTSRSNSGDLVAELKKLNVSGSSIESKNTRENARDDFSDLRKASDCAVEDGDSFEVVTSKKRRSKSRTLSGKAKEPGILDISLRDMESVGQETGHGLGHEQGHEQGHVMISHLGALLAGGRRESTSKRKPIDTPVLGEGVAPEKKQTKIKFAPSMKLSQKERRRLRSESQNNDMKTGTETDKAPAPQAFRNPWKVPSPKTEGSTTVKRNGKVDMLPVLGQKEAPGPKLSTIILEETTRMVEDKQPVVTQTLQEIQQEQEFAKWWEEECRRVQQLEATQQRSHNIESVSRHSERSDTKRGSKPRRGRGNHGAKN